MTMFGAKTQELALKLRLFGNVFKLTFCRAAESQPDPFASLSWQLDPDRFKTPFNQQDVCYHPRQT
jgi:hypothetical protein